MRLDRAQKNHSFAGSKGCSDLPNSGREYQEYEEQYKVRLFLNSECSLFETFLTYLENLDREINEEDVQDYGASPDFLGKTADVTWMNPQLFNVMAQKTRGNPLPDGEDHVRGRRVLRCSSLGQIAACIQAQECKQESQSDSPSEYMTSSAFRRTQKSLPPWKCGKPQ